MTSLRVLIPATALTVFGPSADGQTTYLAVATQYGGHMLPLVVRGGVLTRQATRASSLRTGSVINGLSMRGTPVRVRIDSININDEYDPPSEEFYCSLEGALPPDSSAAIYDTLLRLQDSLRPPPRDFTTLDLGRAAREDLNRRYGEAFQRWLEAYSVHGTPRAVLAWAGPNAPRYLRPHPVVLDAPLAALVRRTADSLWRAALRDLAPTKQSLTYRFGRQQAVTVHTSPERIFVWIQAISSRHDPRGSFFFIIDRRTQRLVHASFGHPEWSPTSTVIRTRPSLFFTVSHDPRTFLLARREGAWEDYSGGWAVLDARTGELVGASN